MVANNRHVLQDALDAPRQELDTGAGGRVSYYADTSGSGVPLVLLHSINAAPSALEMQPLFDHYRGHRPVYALDLPGFGFSERSDIDYSPELYADTLAEFLGKVLDQPADIIALSTTCEFVARMALTSSQRLRSLVLLSPTGIGSREPPSGAASDRLRKLFSIPVFSSGLYRGLTSRASIRYFLSLSFEDRPPVELIDYAWTSARQPGAAYAPFCFLSMRLFTPGASEKLYQPLRVPSLVIYDKDPNINFDKLPELLRSNDSISATRVAPTRGLPHWEEQGDTIAAIDEFWTALPVGEGA